MLEGDCEYHIYEYHISESSVFGDSSSRFRLYQLLTPAVTMPIDSVIHLDSDHIDEDGKCDSKLSPEVVREDKDKRRKWTRDADGSDECCEVYDRNDSPAVPVDPKDEVGERSPLFTPPLYRQRYAYVRRIIEERGVGSVVDFGCSAPKLLGLLKWVPTVGSLVGVDLLRSELLVGRDTLRPVAGDYLQRREIPLEISLFRGSLTEQDSRLKRRCEAVTLVEVVEHLDEETLAALPEAVFGYYRPRIVIVTTPNSEFNVVFPDFSGFRHWDHKFEWTRSQFRDWCRATAEAFGYDVEFDGVGDPPLRADGGSWGDIGLCTQIGLFIKREDAERDVEGLDLSAGVRVCSNSDGDETEGPLELICNHLYPGVERVDPKIARENEIYYCVSRMAKHRSDEMEEWCIRLQRLEQFEDFEDAAAVEKFLEEASHGPPVVVDVCLDKTMDSSFKLHRLFEGDTRALIDAVRRMIPNNPDWRMDDDGGRLWVRMASEEVDEEFEDEELTYEHEFVGHASDVEDGEAWRDANDYEYSRVDAWAEPREKGCNLDEDWDAEAIGTTTTTTTTTINLETSSDTDNFHEETVTTTSTAITEKPPALIRETTMTTTDSVSASRTTTTPEQTRSSDDAEAEEEMEDWDKEAAEAEKERRRPIFYWELANWDPELTSSEIESSLDEQTTPSTSLPRQECFQLPTIISSFPRQFEDAEGDVSRHMMLNLGHVYI